VLSRKLFANVNSLFANGSDGDNASKSPTPGVLLIGSSYREAIRINPQDAVAHYNLGNLLKEQGRAQEAHGVLREAYRIDPSLRPRTSIWALCWQGRVVRKRRKRSHKVWVVSGLLEGSERF